MRDGAAQQLQAVGALPLRVGVREQPPDVARGRRAEHRIGHRVTHDVGVGMAVEALLEGDGDAAQDQRPSLDQAMQVVAGADADRRAPAAPVPSSKSSGVVIFMLAASPATRCAGQPARSVSIASSDASRPSSRPISSARSRTSRRNTCGVCARKTSSRGKVARSAATGRCVAAGLLHRVPHRQRGDCGAVLDRGGDGAIDQGGGNERPRRIVDGDDPGIGARVRHRIGHRVLAPGPALDAAHLRPSQLDSSAPPPPPRTRPAARR